MKKRTYTTPVIAEWSLAGEELLAGSEMTSSEMGITFGGVDDGSHDPMAREFDFTRGE